MDLVIVGLLLGVVIFILFDASYRTEKTMDPPKTNDPPRRMIPARGNLGTVAVTSGGVAGQSAPPVDLSEPLSTILYDAGPSPAQSMYSIPNQVPPPAHATPSYSAPERCDSSSFSDSSYSYSCDSGSSSDSGSSGGGE